MEDSSSTVGQPFLSLIHRFSPLAILDWCIGTQAILDFHFCCHKHPCHEKPRAASQTILAKANALGILSQKALSHLVFSSSKNWSNSKQHGEVWFAVNWNTVWSLILQPKPTGGHALAAWNMESKYNSIPKSTTMPCTVTWQISLSIIFCHTHTEDNSRHKPGTTKEPTELIHRDWAWHVAISEKKNSQESYLALDCTTT